MKEKIKAILRSDVKKYGRRLPPASNRELWQQILPKIVEFDDNGCWIWTGSAPDGYGTISCGGVRWKLHRLAYHVFHGDIGEYHVLHHCDVKRCCNPSHLFLGTNMDNIQDKVRKGRQARVRGMENGTAKITDSDVYRIITLRKHLSLKELSKLFGLAETTVSTIARGLGWKHLYGLFASGREFSMGDGI